MAPTRRSKIPNEQWEERKSIIEQLFLREKCTLKDLKRFMLRDHGFDASESQYEARFRRWGFAKNLRGIDWRIVANIIQERAFRNKRSEVYRDGRRLDEAQVRKEISRKRNDLGFSEDELRQLQDGQLPQYLEIRSPVIQPDGEEGLLEDTTLACDDARETTQSIDIPLLDEGGDSIGTIQFVSSQNNTSTNIEAQSSGNVSQPTELTAGMNGSQNASPSITSQELTTIHSPTWTNFMQGIDSWSTPQVLEKLQYSIPSDTLSLCSLSAWISSAEHKQRHSRSETLFFNRLLERNRKTIIPEHHGLNLAVMVQGASLLHIAILELTNNQLPRDRPSKPVEWMLQYLQNRPQSSFRRLQGCLPPPFSEAFHRNLFGEAFRVEAYQTVKTLLLTGPKPQASVLSHILGRERYARALETMLSSGPLELVKMITRNCDKSSRNELNNRIVIMIRFRNDQEEKYLPFAKIETMKHLLSEGFIMDWETLLFKSVRLGLLNMVKALIELIPCLPGHCLPLKTWQYNRDLFSQAIRHLPEEGGLYVLHAFLKIQQLVFPSLLDDSGQSSAPSDKIKYRTIADIMEHVLSLTVAREFDTTIDFLMSVGTRPTAVCLHEAVCVKRLDLIKRFLDAGVSPVHLIRTDTDDMQNNLPRFNKFEYTTPWASAIRTQQPAALRLFENVSAPPLDGLPRLTFIVAASAVGNLEVLDRLLQPHEAEDGTLIPFKQQFSSDENQSLSRAFIESMAAAKDSGFKRVMSSLFRAGADPALELFEEVIWSRDHEMFTFLLQNAEKIDHDGIIRAAMDCGDRETLLFVLDCIDVRLIQSGGDLLKTAVIRGNATIVQDLLRSGFKSNAPVFHSSEYRRYNEQMELLKGQSLETSIAVAIRNRNKEIIQLLLDSKVSLNPSLGDYFGPFHGTIPSDIKSTTTIISALEAAVAIRDTELIHQLLNRGAEPYDCRAILKLEDFGDWPLLEALLEVGSRRTQGSETEQSWFALLKVIELGKIKLIRHLSLHLELDKLLPLNVFSLDIYPYMKTHFPGGVLRHHSPEMGSLMNILGAALYVGARNSSLLDVVRVLLHSGSNPEAMCFDMSSYRSRRNGTPRSYTALNNAILLNSIACIDLLLEYGADINKPATNIIQRTALQLATELGYADIVSHLILKGADINASPAPFKGLTALQLAAKRGFYPIAELLINKGADVNAPAARIHGRTAFEAATEFGRLDTMLLLVRNGADLLSVTGEKQFERAIRFAEAQGETPAIKLARELRDKIREARDEVERNILFHPVIELDML